MWLIPRWACTILVGASFLLPLPGFSRAEPPLRASNSSVGIVTTISGQVTVARGSLLKQAPEMLKFRDEVYLRDEISTKEHSTLRLLMGGKSLITLRELSVLTITEELGLRSTLHLSVGKVSIAVDRQKMKPGETIEICTPNATATVRGTVFIVEVRSSPDSGMPIPAAGVTDFQPLRAPLPSDIDLLQTFQVVTTFHVLKGRIDVRSIAGLDAPPIILQAGMGLEIAGTAVGTPRPSPPVEQLVRDLKSSPQFPLSPSASTSGRTTETPIPPALAPFPPVVPLVTDLGALAAQVSVGERQGLVALSENLESVP